MDARDGNIEPVSEVFMADGSFRPYRFYWSAAARRRGVRLHGLAGGIFKAGFWAGIIVVVLIVVVLMFLVGKARD